MTINPLGVNITEVSNGKVTVLYSYKAPVAAFIDGDVFVTDKQWSRTTTRHVYRWVNMRGFLVTATKPQEFFDTLLNGGNNENIY